MQRWSVTVKGTKVFDGGEEGVLGLIFERSCLRGQRISSGQDIGAGYRIRLIVDLPRVFRACKDQLDRDTTPQDIQISANRP